MMEARRKNRREEEKKGEKGEKGERGGKGPLVGSRGPFFCAESDDSLLLLLLVGF